MITAGTVCSGIGAPELAGERVGITTLWSSEIERQAMSVYARHNPRTYQLGDIRNVGKHNAAPVEILLGGTPCQDFSIAGGREGLEGEKSRLFFEFIRIIRELKPAIVIWENVFGALSSNAGRDFARVLLSFRECGALDIAYRILDAQHFGVPQRRRRVFVIADFRGQRAGEILFEPESVGGYRPPSRQTGSDIAYALTTRNQRNDAASNETFIGVTAFNARNGSIDDRVAGTLQARAARGSLNATPLVAGTLRANGSGLQYASTNIPGDYLVPEMAFTLRSENGLSKGLQAHNSTLIPTVSGTLAGSGAGSARPAGNANELDFCIPVDGYRVRRLTPREAERLQGFPDDFTRWDANNRELADTPRYAMLGNSMAVPVMEWILRRMVGVLS